MKKNYIVAKSNNLIYAKYCLGLQEQKIILILSSMVQPKDEEFKPYKFKIQDFMKLLDIKDQSKYKELPFLTKELMKKVFEIKDGNKTIQLSWLSSAKYEKGSGTVELCFDPNLKPYLLHLKEMYTTYKLENILELKSKYSIRIYEVLKRNEFKNKSYGYVEFDLQELKTILGADTNSYKTYANFKNRVILKSQEELKKKTDITFEFEEIKTGRKVTGIKFIIKSNKEHKALEEISATVEEKKKTENEYIKKVKWIFDEDISDTAAKKIYKVAQGDIDLIKEKYRLSTKQSEEIENITGWIITAIKKDYDRKKKIDNFSNYDQRDYDYEKLEKQLLGWDNQD